MARKKSRNLTDAELRLMEVLWDKRAATVADVVASLPKSTPLHYSTVLTTLRILENKGYVRHTKDGRAFVYHPAIDRDEAKDSAVAHLLYRFFNGSSEQLVLSLLERKKISRKELERLQRLIREDNS